MQENVVGTKVVRALRGGQVTIPVEFRRKMQIDDSSLLRMTLNEDGELRIKPLTVVNEEQGSPWVKELYDLFAPVRQRILEQGMDDEEINAMIDRSIEEVRAKRHDLKVAEDNADYR